MSSHIGWANMISGKANVKMIPCEPMLSHMYPMLALCWQPTWANVYHNVKLNIIMISFINGSRQLRDAREAFGVYMQLFIGGGGAHILIWHLQSGKLHWLNMGSPWHWLPMLIPLLPHIYTSLDGIGWGRLLGCICNCLSLESRRERYASMIP